MTTDCDLVCGCSYGGPGTGVGYCFFCTVSANRHQPIEERRPAIDEPVRDGLWFRPPYPAPTAPTAVRYGQPSSGVYFRMDLGVYGSRSAARGLACCP